jgi:D-sedoheptulose 7-phosphate isomerase
MTTFSEQYLRESIEALRAIDVDAIEAVARGLGEVRDGGGRAFVLGVGGSAAHASHAVNDLRKLCGFEAYAPTDNAAELTARVNDEGWETTFAAWLEVSRLSARDAVFVLSVGGGSASPPVSLNLVRAIDLARARGAKVFAIVGRDGGHARANADACVLVPVIHEGRVTPHTEGLCAVVLHLLVSHPSLTRAAARWESIASSSERVR